MLPPFAVLMYWQHLETVLMAAAGGTETQTVAPALCRPPARRTAAREWDFFTGSRQGKSIFSDNRPQTHTAFAAPMWYLSLMDRYKNGSAKPTYKEKTCSLPQQTRSELLRFARRCGIHRVVLYGSRARGTNHDRSDIDLAVRGGDTLQFALKVDENVSTLLMIDVIDLGSVLSDELRAEIARDGVILLDNTEQFEKALSNLHHVETITDDTVKDPVIALAASVGLFETCFEQSWRAMKTVLEEQGHAAAVSGSPRQIIQLACRAKLIQDEAGWLAMLQARRLSAHVCDENAAKSVVAGLPKFTTLFEALRSELQHRRSGS